MKLCSHGAQAIAGAIKGGHTKRPQNKALRNQKNFTYFAAKHCAVINSGQDRPLASPILTNFVINVTGKMNHQSKNRRVRWPVSRVLYGPGSKPRTWRPFIWDAYCYTPLATYPDGSRRERATQAPTPSLFGLAPGGVYLAMTVTSHAVRSYRTLSPLPQMMRAPDAAVCFLWHFP